MLKHIQRIPLKFLAGVSAFAVMFGSGAVTLLNIFGYGQQIADIGGGRVMRSALLWLFATPPIVPASLMLLCGAGIIWLVWSATRSEQQFILQNTQTSYALSFMGACRGMIQADLSLGNLASLEQQAREALIGLETWGAAPNPTIGPFLLSKRLEGMTPTQSIVAGFEAHHSSLGLPKVDVAQSAAMASNLSLPTALEAEGEFHPEKRQDARTMYHQLSFILSQIERDKVEVLTRKGEHERLIWGNGLLR